MGLKGGYNITITVFNGRGVGLECDHARYSITVAGAHTMHRVATIQIKLVVKDWMSPYRKMFMAFDILICARK